MTPAMFRGGPIWVFLGSALWLQKPLVLRVGKAWISLDSLVRIETYQWVTRDFRWKKFRAPFYPRQHRLGGRRQSEYAEAQDRSWR